MTDQDSRSAKTIDALSVEERCFPPPPAFAQQANVNSEAAYTEGKDIEGFWAAQAASLVWRKPWDQVLDWSDAPFARWFPGATLNITESCLDQHLEAHGDKVAYLWEGEPGDRRAITYRELHEDVCRLANALASLGVEKGDRVAIYMGMVPELPTAMLACARLGAPHTVIFGGFPAEAITDRINDTEAKVLVTCDGAWRNGEIVPLKEFADAALKQAPSVEKVVVLRRVGGEVPMAEGRDLWWHDLVPGQPA
jgi:acetyl-CoA synthetase